MSKGIGRQPRHEYVKYEKTQYKIILILTHDIKKERKEGTN